MNKHFKISLIKSILRMLGCIIGVVLAAINALNAAIIVLSIMFFIAEGLGILEEIKDERK